MRPDSIAGICQGHHPMAWQVGKTPYRLHPAARRVECFLEK